MSSSRFFRPRTAIAVATGAAVVAGLALAGPATAGLAPATNKLTIGAGASDVEAKVVDVPAVPPQVDIEIAIDSTGSMGLVIAQAQAQATDLVTKVKAAVPGAQFAIVDFKDSADTPEYRVAQPLTSDATAVKTALDGMAASGGDDAPEAYNLVFHNAANPATGGDIGWRAGSRKFVVVIGDAEPHGAKNSVTACGDTSTDPHGYATATELAALKDAQRTLFMVDADSQAACYDAIAALAYSGSLEAPLGTSLSEQLLGLVTSTSAIVGDLHLAVVSAAPAPAAASWITPSSPLTDIAAPGTYDASVKVAVPAGTPAGTYTFDVVALADGADIGHQTLTVEVPATTTLTAKSFSVWVCKSKQVSIALSGTGSKKPLSYTVVKAPSHGKLVPDGRLRVVYKPTPGWGGTDSFQYTVSDGTSVSKPATVTIHVAAPTPKLVHKHRPKHKPVPRYKSPRHLHN
jgi:hypothetical protein